MKNKLKDDDLSMSSTLSQIVVLIFLWWVLLGCEKDPLQDYPYLPDQAYNLEIDVYLLDDVSVRLDKMNLEVNADYLNRYGISATFTIKDTIALEDDILGKQEPQVGRIFLPTDKRDAPNKLNLWVIPYENMIAGVAGYAIGSHNMVVRETFLYGTTVPHEIGHLLGLGHVPEDWNVMYTIGNPDINARPRRFTEEQVSRMIENLTDKTAIESKALIYN